MTVQQIISQAISGGRVPFAPNRFAQELRRCADEHADYASKTYNARARQGAETSRKACLAAADDADFGAVNDICADLGKCVVALNVACKMLGISSAKRTAAIVDWEETQKQRGEW